MNIRFIRGARDKKINVKCCLTYCTVQYFEILRNTSLELFAKYMLHKSNRVLDFCMARE